MAQEAPAARGILKVKVAVIGAGQAGLSAAYHLTKRGLRPHRDLVVLDAEASPGGAWQHRWPSLTLTTVNGIHDLPGLPFAQVLGGEDPAAPARSAVPAYFRAYEDAFDLPIYRPVTVTEVRREGDGFRIEAGRLGVKAAGVVNATGTWTKPYAPEVPGAARFRGTILHTRDFTRAEDFAGRHVVIVGAGISAIQFLEQISQVTTTRWITRRPPIFREGPFDAEAGRAAVAMVEERVRAGLPPRSVVSVTGLPETPAIARMRARGVLERRDMFDEITETGLRWADGSEERADVILWCTGFRPALDHLAPLDLVGPDGGIEMTGRLATQVAAEPRLHLPGYGPSASTVGANRAGRAVATELMTALGLG